MPGRAVGPPRHPELSDPAGAQGRSAHETRDPFVLTGEVEDLASFKGVAAVLLSLFLAATALQLSVGDRASPTHGLGA
jgi:hypothetical protein